MQSDVELTQVVGLVDIFHHLMNSEAQIWSEKLNVFQRDRQSSDATRTSSRSSDFFRSDRENGTERSTMNCAAHILRKGATVDEIHTYFAGLSSRKSTVETQLYSTGTPFRAIQEESKAKKLWGCFLTRQTSTPRRRNRELSRKDEEVYIHALLCAQHHPLCGPGAPPTVSPQLSSEIQDASFPLHVPVHSSASNPDDIGSPDNISVQDEALFCLLRNAFGVNMREHKRIMSDVRQMTAHAGGREKLLLKDLWDHRLKVEYNDHKFYKARAFRNVDWYARWRQREISRTDHLIEKVTGSRPLSCSQGEGSLITRNAHEEYEMLQGKLFMQEMKTRNEVRKGSENYVVSPSVFSSASKQILKEFSLRFGIGVPYRKITEFCCMVKNFELNDWFMRCTVQALDELMNLINAEHEFIVYDELQMLQIVLEELHNYLEYIFIKLKSLCPKILPYKGVSTLVTVLGMVLGAKSVLGLWDEDYRHLGSLVEEYIKNSVRKEYMKCKEISCTESSSRYEDKLCPRLLRRLLQDLREIMKYFKTVDQESAAFQGIIDLPRLVAKTLYEMFMNDVKELCVERTTVISTETVDVEMLKLAYRIAQLDKEWANYVPCQDQKWRTYYVLESRVIMTSVADHLHKIIKTCILNDNWRKIVCDNVEPEEDTQKQRANGTDSLSPSSLIPSSTSAFSAVNTPTAQRIMTPLSTGTGALRKEETLYTEKKLTPIFDREVSTEDDSSSLDEEIAQYSENNSWKRLPHYTMPSTSVSVDESARPKRKDVRVPKITERLGRRCLSSTLADCSACWTETKSVTEKKLHERSKSLSSLYEQTDVLEAQPHYALDDICVRYGVKVDVLECNPLTFDYSQSELQMTNDDHDSALPDIDSMLPQRLSRSKSVPAVLAIETFRSEPSILVQEPSENTISESDLAETRTGTTVSRPTLLSDDGFDDIPFGAKVTACFTSSVIDILVAIGRFCSITGDLVCLLTPPLTQEQQNLDIVRMCNQLKTEFYDRFMRSLSDVLTTYAQGLLTLDLCGIGKRVITGYRYREIIRAQQDGFILGCRHEPTRRYISPTGREFCPTLLRIRKFFPAEWEPVTVEMCNRINNISALKDVLFKIQTLTENVLRVSEDTDEAQLDADLQNSSSPLCAELRMCSDQLKQILAVLVNCLSFRTFSMYTALLDSLFLLDMPCVKYIHNCKASFGDQIKPVSDFLNAKVQMFRKDLIRPCAIMVTRELWRFIVEDIHKRITDFSTNWIDATYKAMPLIIMVPLLLNAVDVFEDRTFSAEMIEKSESLLFRAELYTLTCGRINDVYNALNGMESLHEEPLNEDEIVTNLKRRLPGSFSGRQFIRVLVRDSLWMEKAIRSCGLARGDSDVRTACILGKYLLEQQVIECKELPPDHRRPLGEALVPAPRRNPSYVIVVGRKRMVMHEPRGSQESLLSAGHDARPHSTVSSQFTDEDPMMVIHNTDESEYIFTTRGSWQRSLFGRLREFVRQSPSIISIFKEDIKSVLRFQSLVKGNVVATASLREIDPDFTQRRPFSCPCIY